MIDQVLQGALVAWLVVLALCNCSTTLKQHYSYGDTWLTVEDPIDRNVKTTQISSSDGGSFPLHNNPDSLEFPR